MALDTRHVGMAAGQSEVGAGIVIECGGNPALGIVAIDAMGLSVLGLELRIVSLDVAGFTLLRSAFET